MKDRGRFEDFYISIYHVFALYLIALVAAFNDRWVGAIAFVCVTIVLCLLILILREKI